jgi:putative Mn2+ efflux pump MntP
MKAATKQVNKTTTALGGMLGLVLSYAFISRAFNTGNYWQYLGFLVFLILGIKLLVRTFKSNGKK